MPSSFHLSLTCWDTGFWTPEFFQLSEETLKKSGVTRSVHSFIWIGPTVPTDFFYLTESHRVLLLEVGDLGCGLCSACKGLSLPIQVIALVTRAEAILCETSLHPSFSIRARCQQAFEIILSSDTLLWNRCWFQGNVSGILVLPFSR